jgi:hypothetical protein
VGASRENNRLLLYKQERHKYMVWTSGGCPSEGKNDIKKDLSKNKFKQKLLNEILMNFNKK